MPDAPTIFDGSAGNWTVTRNASTIDHQLVVRAANQARLAPDTAVCDRPEWGTKATISTGGATYTIVARGYDHDGTTPLMLLFTLDSGELLVLRGDEYGLYRTVECLTDFGFDLLADYPNAKDFYRHRPVTGTICYGLITLDCEVLHDENEDEEDRDWQKWGEATLYTQDLFDTISFVQNVGGGDYPTPVTGSLGVTRLARFTQQNYHAYPAKATPVLRAFFCPPDYLANPGAPGGRADLYDATRAAEGGPWTVGARYTVATYTAAGRHCHCAGAVVHGSVLHYISVWGDGTAGGTVRHMCSDVDDYTTGANWTEQRAFFGDDAAHGAESVPGNQFAGIAPGPTFDTLLGSSDTQYGYVVKMTVPASAVARGTVEVLHGAPLQTQAGNECLHIVADRPEINRGWVAQAASVSIGTRQHMQGTLYSADGEHWTTLAQNLGAGSLPYFYGNDIVTVRKAGDTTTLYGCRRPTYWRVIQPLTVAPGGTNYTDIIANLDLDAYNSYTVLNCPVVSGTYRWPVGTALAGQPIDPQPVTKGIVLYFETSRAGTDGTTFTAWSWTQTPSSIAGPVHAARTQVMLVSNSAAAPGLSYTTFNNFGDAGWLASVPGNGKWYPYPWAKNQGATNFTPFIIFSVGTTSVAATGFVAIDVHNNGPHLSYPIAPNTTAPNEEAESPALGFGGVWSLDFMGGVPHDSWDQWQIGLILSEIPLFTAWGDADNYIEFWLVKGADADAVGTLEARVVSDGVEVGVMEIADVWCNKQTPIGFSLRCTGSGLALSATVGGPPVKTDTLAEVLDVQPTKFHIGNHDMSTVVPFVVTHFRPRNGVAWSDAQAAAILTGTALLRQPSGVEDEPPASVFRRR